MVESWSFWSIFGKNWKDQCTILDIGAKIHRIFLYRLMYCLNLNLKYKFWDQSEPNFDHSILYLMEFWSIITHLRSILVVNSTFRLYFNWALVRLLNLKLRYFICSLNLKNSKMEHLILTCNYLLIQKMIYYLINTYLSIRPRVFARSGQQCGNNVASKRTH